MGAVAGVVQARHQDLHQGATNEVSTQKTLLHALQSRLDRVQIPRPTMETTRQRNLQIDSDLCPSILDTVFAQDYTSRTICTCQATTEMEYLLDCDYSQQCGTICTEPGFSTDTYQCFHRKDRYMIQLTDDFYVNTLYEGCGTYETEGTTVCLMEMRHLDGLISSRCLNIDGESCQCSTGSCGEYNFFCRPPLGATWEPFGIDECDDNNSYGSIEPGTVESLLSSVIFDTEQCFVEPEIEITTSTVVQATTPITTPDPPVSTTLSTTEDVSISSSTEPVITIPTEEEDTTSTIETTETSVSPPSTLPQDPQPFVATVTMPLNSFSIVFSLKESNNKWHPNSMERGVKRIIMSTMIAQMNLHDLQLTCRWLGTPVFQNGVQTRTGGTSQQSQPQAQLECYGFVEVDAQDMDQSTADHMIQVEVPTLLHNTVTLSTLLSEQLGETVVVLQVDVDIPLLPNIDESIDEPIAEDNINSSAGKAKVHTLISISGFFLALVSIVSA
jgi:hypothetical protein